MGQRAGTRSCISRRPSLGVVVRGLAVFAAIILVVTQATGIAAANAVAGQTAPVQDAPRALGPEPPVSVGPRQGGPPPSRPAGPATFQPGSSPNPDDEPLPSNAQIFEGTGVFVAAPGERDHAPSDAQAGDVTLDFADADVHDVIRAVLGDMLKLPYSIDSQVGGHITLKTGAPISRDAVLPAFETALKAASAAVVLIDGIYNVVPIADAQRRGGQIAVGPDQSVAAGYGVEIVALHFISADAMQKIVGPLVPQGSILSIDPQRNLIFIAGTEPERASIRDTIGLFDVDYLEGMSYALIQPAHVDVGTLATELSKVFDDVASPIAGLVRMIPIARINTLLVVSPRASYLRQVSRWITRLDVIPITPGRQLHYYRVQNARAADVAQTLGELFGGSAQGAPPTSTQAAATQSPVMASMTGFGGSTSNGSSLQGSFGAEQPAAAAPAESGGTHAFRASGGDGDGPQIVTDESNNALIIRADAADYASIEAIVKEMDVAPDQVLIEATIAEVTLTDQLKYGTEWYFQYGGATFVQGPTTTPSVHLPGFGMTYTIPNVQVALSALGSLTKISVLSAPKILTLDNKPALLEVGDQVPIVTQTAVSAITPNAPLVSTVAERDTGVILTVTPRIGNSGMVFLDVSQEVSASVPTTTSGIDSPTIQQRLIHTTVAVADGTTVALGGLMQKSETTDNSGLPYLKDIPVLGALFGTADNTRDRTELLVFLTPHVVRTVPAAQAVTDDLSKGLDDVRRAIEYFDHHKNNIPRMPWR